MNALKCNKYVSFFLLVWITALPLQKASADISQVPLFISRTADPLVMLTMSNDHQLYLKAYSDYDDVNGDGVLDTEYNDAIDYYGYFDSYKCYTYGSDKFSPSRALSKPDTGETGVHECGGSNEWSGNFLNWATMTRMDVLRKVLFGGFRSTDTDASTVLERVFLPRDIHAFVKVFSPSGGGSTIRKFTPWSAHSQISICNVSEHDSGESQNSSALPKIRVASDSWPLWAAGETKQCWWGGSSTSPSTTYRINDYTARVDVCKAGLLEDNCEEYPNGNNKPVGLLQTYGNVDAGPALRFGLLTGSYQKNLSGGMLRKNITRIAGGADVATADKEVDQDSGIFLNQDAGDEGIINTINRLRISKWSPDKYQDCNNPGITAISEGDTTGSYRNGCSNWGNPVGEMYLETVRYFVGGSSPVASTAFDANDTGYIPGIPDASWQDPYSTDTWCAKPSVILISTGLNSFDDDQYTNASSIPGLSGSADVATLTDEIGDLEGISNQSFFIGEAGSNNDLLCTAKTVSKLSEAKGLCPEIPNQKGGFNMAGLAWHAHTQNLRSDITPTGEAVTLDTYALALAQGLPRFTVNGITFLPACRSYNWSNEVNTCSLGDLKILDMTYEDGNLVAGELLIAWEDSSWGNDYDLDGLHRIEFCTGSYCSPAANNSNLLKITHSSPYQAAGFRLEFGHTISGTEEDDGINWVINRPGGANRNCIDLGTLQDQSYCTGEHPMDTGDNNSFPKAYVEVEKASSGASANVLNPPLWYTAKYGSFTEEPGQADNKPNVKGEWDSDDDGDPDNYFLVTNPSSLAGQLGRVFDSIARQRSSAASVASNSSTLQEDTAIFQSRFNSGTWSGDLIAITILRGEQSGELNEVDWRASEKMPDASARTIISYDPTADSNQGAGIPFQWNGTGKLNDDQKAALNINPVTQAVDNLGEDRLNYLRGDQSKETATANPPEDGIFRSRESILGDIVNSTPFYVDPPSFTYPDDIESADGAKYSTFQATHANRVPMLFTGANDGMLHGFNASVGADTDDAVKGKELLAYVPNAVYENLNRLSSPGYQHQYYVNAPVSVVDAFFSGSNTWHTVLVGGLGAGGKAIYALDVTNPAGFSEAEASSLVLWEIDNTRPVSSGKAVYEDLGFTFSQPSIVKLPNDDWGVIFGNGYSSADGKAVLYTANVKDGSLITKVEVGAATANGLSTPAVVDVDADFVADYIYAGDLLGNVWKFEWKNGDWVSAFKSGNTPAPFFKADNGGSGNNKKPQPITTRIEVGKNPRGEGQMIYFGTGKYFEDADTDLSSAITHTFYGVIDDNKGNGSLDRSDLVEQVIEKEEYDVQFDDQTYDIRVISEKPIAGDGWYLDLVSPAAGFQGERVITDSILKNDRIIFTTLVPSELPCESDTGWLMELDANSGGRTAESVFDLNGDGKIDENDLLTTGNLDEVVNGKRSKVGVPQQPTIIGDGEKEYKYISGSDVEEGDELSSIEVTTEASGDDIKGRLYWQQLR